jgi:hypothetical protein
MPNPHAGVIWYVDSRDMTCSLHRMCRMERSGRVHTDLEGELRLCLTGHRNLKTGCAEILPEVNQGLKVPRTQGCWEDMAWKTSQVTSLG